LLTAEKTHVLLDFRAVCFATMFRLKTTLNWVKEKELKTVVPGFHRSCKFLPFLFWRTLRRNPKLRWLSKISLLIYNLEGAKTAINRAAIKLSGCIGTLWIMRFV
jgi:hypothetical protein